MKKIRGNGHIPIIVGGTGFYIQAILNDIDFKENEVKEAIEKAGMTVLEVTHQGEWVSITARK